MKRQSHNVVIASFYLFYKHCSSCLKPITSGFVHSVSCADVPFYRLVLVVSKEHFRFNAKWFLLIKTDFLAEREKQTLFWYFKQTPENTEWLLPFNDFSLSNCWASSAGLPKILLPEAMTVSQQIKKSDGRRSGTFSALQRNFYNKFRGSFFTFFSAIIWTNFSGEKSSRFISSLSSNWGDFWMNSRSTIFKISLLRGEVDPKTNRQGAFLNIFWKERSIEVQRVNRLKFLKING